MDEILRLYAWNLQYARALVADLVPEQCTESGGPGLENHPAWTIGHLVSGADILAEDLGLERDMPAGWGSLFERRGPGDPRRPDPDTGAYPPMEELLVELGRQHVRVADAWRDRFEGEDASEPRLAELLEWRYGDALPTLGDAALFLAITHESLHLGQLEAWRRAKGLPSALGAL